MNMESVIEVLRAHSWAAVAAFVLGGIVWLTKERTPTAAYVPARWRPVLAVALGQAAAILEVVSSGAAWRDAAVNGALATVTAILGHIFGIEVARNGRELLEESPTGKPPVTVSPNGQAAVMAMSLLALLPMHQAVSGCGGGLSATPTESLSATQEALVSGATPIPCLFGGPPTATCIGATVKAQGPSASADPMNVRLSISNPPGVVGATTRAPAGTVVMFSGGGGQGFSPEWQAVLDGVVAAGFKGIGVSNNGPDWQNVSEASIPKGASRVAELLRWLHPYAHATAGHPERGFCGLGTSGGSAAVAYAIAHHNAGSVVDLAILVNGPPLARLDYGCLPTLYAPTGRGPNPCGGGMLNNILGYPALTAAQVDVWEGTANCGSATPTASALAAWAQDSIVSPTGVFDFPYTPVHFVTCANPHPAYGQSVFLEQAITSSKQRHCIPCSGEAALSTEEGIDAIVSTIIAKCHSTRGG